MRSRRNLAFVLLVSCLALPSSAIGQGGPAGACTTDEAPAGLLEFGVFRRAATPADSYPRALPSLRATFFRNHIRFVRRLGRYRYFLLPALIGDPLGSAGCPTTADGTENALLWGVGPGRRELKLGSVTGIAFAFTGPGRKAARRPRLAWAMVPDEVATATFVWRAVESRRGRCCLTVRRTVAVTGNVVLDQAPSGSDIAYVSKLILRAADGSVVGVRG